MIVILDCCFPKKIKRASKYHRTTKFEQTLFPQTTTSSCLCWSLSMAQRAICRKWSNQMLSFQSKSRIYLKPLGTFLYCLSGFTIYNFYIFWCSISSIYVRQKHVQVEYVHHFSAAKKTACCVQPGKKIKLHKTPRV